MNRLRYLLAMVCVLILAPIVMFVGLVEELFDVYRLPGNGLISLLAQSIYDVSERLLNVVYPEDW